MPNSASILVYGRDARLLETRHLVLRTLGGEVSQAADRRTAEQLVTDLRPAVLVLCYTLSSEERDLIITFVKMVSPATRVLVLQADNPPSTQTDSNFSIYAGPAALKARVVQMLLAGPDSAQTN